MPLICLCGIWRSIALLDVMRKVVIALYPGQGDLDLLSEPAGAERRNISESWCGFRKGLSCPGMIFTVCLLFECKARPFLIFVGLKKA